MPSSPERVEWPQEKPEIIWKWANEALNALDMREVMFIAEAEERVSWGMQTTEFTHRNGANCCDFINNSFPSLEELIFLG